MAVLGPTFGSGVGIDHETRRVEIAGIVQQPHGAWMKQGVSVVPGGQVRRGLLGPIGHGPSAEYEAVYYRGAETPVMVAALNPLQSSGNPGGSMNCLRIVLCGLVSGLFVFPAAAQTWTESGDAMSFPDGAAQRTQGAGALTSISGATTGPDDRDAYCIKIVDPANFRATTDPTTDPTASADFDTRLFLFAPLGEPVLANDDTPPSTSPFRSTLTGVATDASSFVLDHTGEYLLVVAGTQQALDVEDGDLFDLDAGAGLVHARDPLAGRFSEWDGSALETGDYTVALRGVEYCQEKLDVVFMLVPSKADVCAGAGDGSFGGCGLVDITNSNRAFFGFLDGDAHLDVVFGHPGKNQRCLGSEQGLVSCIDIEGDDSATSGMALGFIDDDQDLDVIIANLGAPDRVCLGNGAGGLGFCSNIDETDSASLAVALGFLDDDAILDAVFADRDGANRVCEGLGLGLFSCTTFDGSDSRDVALGDFDGDTRLDVIFANSGQRNRVCLGDGELGFTCSDTNTAENETSGLALGFFDDDAHLDAIFANSGQRNRICLGDGLGGFTQCADVTAEERSSVGVAAGFVNADGHLDAVFANSGSPSVVCLGDGSGAFSSCDGIALSAANIRGVALGELGPLYIFRDSFESGELSDWSSVVPESR